MKQNNEIVLPLGRNNQIPTLDGYANPPFDGSAVGVTLDVWILPESTVPYRHENGTDYWLENKGDRPRECISYIFKLSEPFTKENQEEQFKVIGAFTHALTFDWELYHANYRTLYEGKDKNVRTFIYRVYKTVPGECGEHPELLSGAPIGMYHCPVCMHMVVAGVPHPLLKDLEEA